MPNRYDDATIHLKVLGQDCDIHARVRTGPCRPVEVLPLSRRLTDAITDAALRHAAGQGRTPSCQAGCAACCKHPLVPVAPIEALGLARIVKAMPGKQRETVRRRFAAAAVRRLEELGLIDRRAPPGRTQLTADAAAGKSAFQVAAERYFTAGIACPFLESERCSIHADRPAACRQHISFSAPALCASLGSEADVMARPVEMVEVLAELTASLGGHDPAALPLPLALEWAEVYAESLEAEVPGEELAQSLLERMAVSE